MWKYILKRLLLTIPILLAVVFIVFTLLYFAPGDITIQMLGTQWTPEAAAALKHELGLDLPFFVQFINYIGGIFTGNLGMSFMSREPVAAMLAVCLPNTLYILVTSVTLAVVISIPIGILAALKPNSWFSGFTTAFSLIGVSAPAFWVGLLLVLLFSLRLGWLPASGLESPAALILPAVTMSLTYLASLSRTTRSSMIEAMRMDYIRTARAKGVTETKIVAKHALRNALIPVVTMMGLQFGFLLGGSIVVEKVFNWPGMGRLLVDAVDMRDYPVIQASVLLFSLEFIVINLVVDVLYGWINPSIRYK